MSRATRPIARSPRTSTNGSSATASGEMAPFSSFAQTSWMTDADQRSSRFHGYPSYEIQGQARAGRQLRQGDGHIAALAAQDPGISVAWAANPTRSGCRPARRRCSTRCRCSSSSCAWRRSTKAGRSRSRCCWSFRSACIGAVLAVTLRGLENDVYLQVGLLTTMGLSAKNAILMVEFAERAEREGKRVIDAAIEAAQIRLRPILMTSFAFIFGVLPLALLDRRGREQPDRDRHRGDRRNADRDLARDLLHSVVLRAGPARRARRRDRDPRAHPPAAGGAAHEARNRPDRRCSPRAARRWSRTMSGPSRRCRHHGRSAIPISSRPRRRCRRSPTAGVPGPAAADTDRAGAGQQPRPDGRRRRTSPRRASNIESSAPTNYRPSTPTPA